MHKRDPTRYTCPDIDEVIGLLEKLRKSNGELRDWGKQEADHVDELESELATAEQDKEDLQKQLDDANDRITELEQQLSNTHDTVPSPSGTRSEGA